MQLTFQLNTENLNANFLKSVRAMFGRREIRIVIEDIEKEETSRANAALQEEQEKAFYSLFGSWESEESGDELVKQIYSARNDQPREIDL